MRTTTETWAALAAARHTHAEYKFVIDGTEYTEAEEESHKVRHALYEAFGIGNATIGELELTIYAESIPRAAKIERMVRLVGEDGTTSEWMAAGVYFASRRSMDDGKWTIEAYDAMRKANVVWEPDQALEFPMAMATAVTEFCRILEVELDERTALAEYTIDYPTDECTIRNILCYIGAANCGNWIITPEGKLHLVPVSTTATAHEVGWDIMRFEDNGARRAVTRVTLNVDSEQALTAGGDYGIEIVADCPYATQAMADTLLTKLQGYVYHPYEAGAARIDPAMELGDPVLIGDIESVVASVTDDGVGYPDISAPGEEELEEEYPSAGPMTQQINRKIAENKSYIKKTADEVTLAVEGINGELSKLSMDVDSIQLSVSDPTSDGYVSLQLIVGGVTQSLGMIKIDGNVDISGSLSAEALYANLGDVAQLTVDSLSTARKIPRYLAGDTSDINYIDIRDRRLAMVRAWTDGSTEQATNPNGQALYWETDISGATIGDDGYPYIEGTRVFSTANVTDYPVTIYKYDEGDRWLQTTDEGNNYGPRQVWGEGDGTSSGYGRGYIEKLGLSFDVYNRGTDGKRRGTFMSNEHLDAYGLRKYTSITEDGADIVVALDGDITEIFTRSYDSNGGLIGVTDQVGFFTSLTNPLFLPLAMIPRLLGAGADTQKVYYLAPELQTTSASYYNDYSYISTGTRINNTWEGPSSNHTIDWLYRAYFKYDLSGIPPTSRVLRATFHAYCGYQARNAMESRQNLYPCTGDWTEESIKWTNQPPHAGPYYDNSFGAIPLNTWGSLDVTELVRRWQGGEPNYGFVIIGEGEKVVWANHWDVRNRRYGTGKYATYLMIEMEVKGQTLEPTTYAFNGVPVPKLPEWDRSTYPQYVLLEDTKLACVRGEYPLVYGDTALGEACVYFRVSGDDVTDHLQFTLVDGVWTGPVVVESSVPDGYAYFQRVFPDVWWSHADIPYFSDTDTIYLAGGDELPLR